MRVGVNIGRPGFDNFFVQFALDQLDIQVIDAVRHVSCFDILPT